MNSMKFNFQCFVIFFASVLIGLSACQNDHEPNGDQAVTAQEKAESNSGTFQLRTAEESGLKFNNEVTASEKINAYNDLYIYNGGGVGIGDINNDGLADIFFTGNQSPNKLFLNKGNLQFEDISTEAGIASLYWHSGVSFVDINQDGWLDIYVSRAGCSQKNPENRKNLLFINQKNLTFTEEAAAYGIDFAGFNTDAIFFDMDRDNDLDLFVGSFPTEEVPFQRAAYEAYSQKAPEYFRDKLYRNDGKGKFADVTKAYGIDKIGFTLGIGISDINADGYPDIYLGNDFDTDDIYYENNKGKGFVNKLANLFRHTSNYSMGLDIGDINNDALHDIVVTDMNPGNNYRQKTNMPSMNPNLFWTRINEGLHPQFMRNVLQLNQGSDLFSDIGQLAGISKTDWTWSVLMEDFDNDGWKDMVFSNGILKNSVNKDVTDFIKKRMAGGHPHPRWSELKDMLPDEKIPNQIFQNNRDLSFTDRSDDWGFQSESISNGLAVGDLDNDGDLDIVINNINQNAFLLENKLHPQKNFIRFKLKGPEGNINAVGAKVKIAYNGEIQFIEFFPNRGYQSSSDYLIHFGMDAHTFIDSAYVYWPDGKLSKIGQLKTNQTHEIDYNVMTRSDFVPPISRNKMFSAANDFTGIYFRHIENKYNDYDDQVLLPHKMSRFGPNISIGDLNGDGFPEFYVSGASGQSGEVYGQVGDMKFVNFPNGPWAQDAMSEDQGSVFFDADSDGDQDIYVVSGGYEFDENTPALQDRLYLNNGKGTMSKAEDALPEMKQSGSCVCAADFDHDGDMDLFVGGRLKPKNYPHPGRSYILENKEGKFIDVTDKLSGDIKHIGMVNTCLWTDIENDGNMELILGGDWMSIEVFGYDKGKMKRKTKAYGLDQTNGWWNKVISVDIDHDGDLDYVAGNLGLNYKYKANKNEPFTVYFDDMTDNGSTDIVLGYMEDGTEFPLRGFQCSSEQMPELKSKFKNYEEFAISDINAVYGQSLRKAKKYEAFTFASVLLRNEDGKLKIENLPNEAQISPIFGIVSGDFNVDGNEDLLLAGNLYVAEVETGMADAGAGTVLLGDGAGNFKVINNEVTGLAATQDVRDLAFLKNPRTGKGLVLIGNNNAPIQAYSLNSKVK